MDINENVLDAIEILIESALKKAKYDRTVEAQILNLEDTKTRKYKCKEQDAIFTAYATPALGTLVKGDSVYVLIPGNDLGEGKTIIAKKY